VSKNVTCCALRRGRRLRKRRRDGRNGRCLPGNTCLSDNTSRPKNRRNLGLVRERLKGRDTPTGGLRFKRLMLKSKRKNCPQRGGTKRDYYSFGQRMKSPLNPIKEGSAARGKTGEAAPRPTQRQAEGGSNEKQEPSALQ